MASTTMAEFVATLRKPKILGICGSQRTGSFNRKLLECAGTCLTDQGAEFEMLDLAALNLPLFDPNDEAASFPEGAKLLKRQLIEADGVIFTCPEYNGMVTPLLLNGITWATRGEGGMYDGFKGKVVSVMATSPGAMGGMRMIRNLQQMLQDMGSVVVPGNCAIGGAMKVFAEDGTISDERTLSKVATACGQMVHFARFEANRAKDCEIVAEIQRQKNIGEYGSVE